MRVKVRTVVAYKAKLSYLPSAASVYTRLMKKLKMVSSTAMYSMVMNFLKQKLLTLASSMDYLIFFGTGIATGLVIWVCWNLLTLGW